HCLMNLPTWPPSGRTSGLAKRQELVVVLDELTHPEQDERSYTGCLLIVQINTNALLDAFAARTRVVQLSRRNAWTAGLGRTSAFQHRPRTATRISVRLLRPRPRTPIG